MESVKKKEERVLNLAREALLSCKGLFIAYFENLYE
jgi:hypothetical protein